MIKDAQFTLSPPSHLTSLCITTYTVLDNPVVRVVKGIFVTRDRPFFFPVKYETANFFLVNRDFHSSREP
jgi:hypothetical protein